MNLRITEPSKSTEAGFSLGTSIISTENWSMDAEVLPVDQFRSLFKTFAHSAFRLETLPFYSVSHEDQHFAAYLSGAKEPPFIAVDWKKTIAAATMAGKSFEVVRLVPDPLTTYFRYELEWHYREYEKDGQVTKFLLPEQISESLRPACNKDFWLFDDSFAVAMIYDCTGNISKRCKVSDPLLLAQLKDWKTLALENSISFKDYMPVYSKS